MKTFLRKQTLACVAALCAALAACAVAAGAEAGPGGATRKLNPRIAALGDNCWVNLAPGCTPRGRNYSGGCLGEGVVWYFGGGHSSYEFNDVEIFDVAANTWTQLTEPESWRQTRGAAVMGGGGGTIMISSRLRPFGEHTYQQFCWLPGRRTYFGWGFSGTWEFDPAKKEWRCLAGMHAGKLAGKAGPLVPAKFEGKRNHHEDVVTWRTRDGREVVPPARSGRALMKSPSGWKTADGQPVDDVGTSNPLGDMHTGDTLCMYDPVLGKPLAMISGRVIYAFDFGEMAWEKFADSPIGGGLDQYSTYVPDQLCHLVSAKGRGWWRFYPAKKKFEQVAGLPDDLADCQRLAYDTANRVVLALPDTKKNVDTFWTFDPATGRFAEVPRSQSRPAKVTGRWGTFWYDPVHNACLLIITGKGMSSFPGGETETWAYRYRKAGSPAGGGG